MRNTIIDDRTGVASHMAQAETMSTRSPRGTKPVSQAFFAALESIPTASRAAVAKAAQAMIRDELKHQRDTAKIAAVKQKTPQPDVTKKLTVTKKSAVAKPLVKRKTKTAAMKATAPASKVKALKAVKPAVKKIAPKKVPTVKVASSKIASSKPVEAPAET